jgi:hypothetical protein
MSAAFAHRVDLRLFHRKAPPRHHGGVIGRSEALAKVRGS